MTTDPHLLFSLQSTGYCCVIYSRYVTFMKRGVFVSRTQIYRRASICKKHSSGVLVFGGLLSVAYIFHSYTLLCSLGNRPVRAPWCQSMPIYCIASVLQEHRYEDRSPTEHPLSELWTVRYKNMHCLSVYVRQKLWVCFDFLVCLSATRIIHVTKSIIW